MIRLALVQHKNAKMPGILGDAFEQIDHIGFFSLDELNEASVIVQEHSADIHGSVVASGHLKDRLKLFVIHPLDGSAGV